MLVTRIAELRVRTVPISGTRMFSRVGSRASEHGSTCHMLPRAESFTVHHYLVTQAMLDVAGMLIGSGQSTSPISVRNIVRCLDSRVFFSKLSLDFRRYSFFFFHKKTKTKNFNMRR